MIYIGAIQSFLCQKARGSVLFLGLVPTAAAAYANINKEFDFAQADCLSYFEKSSKRFFVVVFQVY